MAGQIRDVRMMARALEQRWSVKPEYRDALIRRLMRIVADPDSSNREVTAAARALIAAEKQNQEDEHKLIDVNLSTRDTELAAIASDLGIEESLIIDASSATGRGLASSEERTGAVFED